MRAKLGEGAKPGYDARVGSGLGRGPNLRKKAVAAPWSGTWPAPGATLDLDFANNRGFVRGVGQGGAMDAVTFTRASNATFVKPDGTLSTHANQGALGKNLLTFPQDFDNAAWTKDNLFAVANAALAPNNTQTAEHIFENTANNNRQVFQAITLSSAGSVTFSISAKYISRYLQLAFVNSQVSGDPYANFDLINGTYTTSGTITASMSAEANGFYRCSITVTTAGTAATALALLINSTSAGFRQTYVGDGSSGIYIWGAQLELGSTATEYFPTNINQPRFDWASTAVVANKNLFNFTNNIPTTTNTNGWGLLNVTVTQNATTAPITTSNADAIYETTTNGLHYFNNNSLNIIQDLFYTYSIYVKANGRTQCRITGTSTGWSTDTSTFDLSAVTSSSTGSATSTITDVGSGWFRITHTRAAVATVGGNTANIFFLFLDDTGASSYAGDVTKGFFVSSPQLEQNSSATDYQANAQPTTNTPLTANPTSNGLLIEESRTNRILWNRDASQANWVSTNITAAKDQTGIDGVASAASSLTATADGGTCIQTITLASGSRTGSVYLKRITGTGTVQVSLDGSTYSTVDLSDTEWRRIRLSGTATNPTVGIKIATNGDAVAMDYAQVEDGAFATTPILTTTATVTRSADTASVFGQNFVSFFNANQGVFYVEAEPKKENQVAAVVTVQLNAAANNNAHNIFKVDSAGNAAGKRWQATTFLPGNVFQAAITSSSDIATEFSKLAYSYQRQNFAFAANGTLIGSNAGLNTGNIVLPNQMSIGCRVSSFQLNGTIKKITYGPKSLTPDALVELTK
jgi:hypothetical protein